MQGGSTITKRRQRAACAAAASALLAAASLAHAQERGCGPRDAITATVKSVGDGRSLLLADNREVRLAAIEVPLAMQTAASAALAARVGDRNVVLSALTPASDRYGRLNMLAFEAGATAAPIEAALVGQGLALTAVRDPSPCLILLKGAEASARRGKLGLWGRADDLRADKPAAILAGRGGFALVEGRILSVRESGGTIYLNFGRRWSEDFTVTILKRNERKLASAGVVPRQLEGRTVRVRGYVEERGGPWIELVSPQQIELADGR